MPTVQLKSARTTKTSASEAADDLLTQLGGTVPKLVTLFVSCQQDQVAINRAVRERLPKETRLIGASAGYEIDSSGFHQGSVVLGALSGDFEVGLGLGPNLAEDAIGAGVSAVAKASSELGVRPADLNPRRHVGLVIDDSSKMKKEELLLGMLEKNQSLLLVGGGASDQEYEPPKQKRFVHLDGEVTQDAAVIALFSTEAPFGALRSHFYEPTGKTLTITKVDDSHQIALEIDGKPAAARYAEILGVTPEQLDFRQPQGFAYMPTALRVGREYFMRAPMFPLPFGGIFFSNLLEEGTELDIMRRGDVVGITRRFFEQDIPRLVQSPQAALFFNCEARAMVGMSTGTMPELSQAFQVAPPCVGFNCSFEIYCGFHINTTLTALVFGKK